MFVCVCHAVTDTQIREAVENGCCSMRDLRNELNVATQCGRCACHARDLLHTTLLQIQEPMVAAAA